ncbi:hypothetical protein ACWPKO_22410 (plasmid) [Coraliomargarita sp. W4R53]
MTRRATAPMVGGIPRVNLMPRADVERRNRAGTIRRWRWGLIVTFVLLVLIIAGAVYQNSSAGQRLAVQQDNTHILLAELASPIAPQSRLPYSGA